MNPLSKYILRHIPQKIHSIVFRLLISKVFNKNPHAYERLRDISGKAFRLDVRDIDKTYSFYVEGNRIHVDHRDSRHPDVILRGDFKDLLDLFLHRADADSLFFARRIRVEGDIKTSVFLKNIIEHLDI